MEYLLVHTITHQDPLNLPLNTNTNTNHTFFFPLFYLFIYLKEGLVRV